MSYLLTEKLTSTIACYMIIKRLLRPFDQWEAYKNGIIDAKGNRIRKPKTAKEREGWDILDRFCWSIKRLLGKFGGDNKFAYLFSAAYLMKENFSIAVTQNIKKYESDLSDLTCEKQMMLYQLMLMMEQQGLMKEEKLDFETNILKLYTSVQGLVGFRTISCTLFEDAGAAMGGTALGDVAQFTPVINTTKRINKVRVQRRSKTIRIKRGTYHGNNHKK